MELYDNVEEYILTLIAAKSPLYVFPQSYLQIKDGAIRGKGYIAISDGKKKLFMKLYLQKRPFVLPDGEGELKLSGRPIAMVLHRIPRNIKKMNLEVRYIGKENISFNMGPVMPVSIDIVKPKKIIIETKPPEI